MSTPTSKSALRTPAVLFAAAFLATLPVAAGCRQKMADQPYYRPLEESEFFPDKRGSRPLERGVIHRAQYLDRDPIATGLTAAEWDLSDKYSVPPKIEEGKEQPTLTLDQRRERAIGAPRYDQRQPGQPKVFADEFPFEITQQDLKRGQERYTIYCAACHGPLGNGQGKIWERGYLQPTSFHLAKADPKEAHIEADDVRGRSRGYWLWGHQIPMEQVPVGYYFEVITKGYGGMPSYSAQVGPEDRWRIIAYIRVLQMSQHTDPAKPKLNEAGGKK